MRTTSLRTSQRTLSNAFRTFPQGQKNGNLPLSTGGHSARSPQRATPFRLDWVLRTLKVALTVSGELGPLMQYGFCKSGNSKTQEKKGEQQWKGE